MANQKKRIGIFGGTFDPFTKAHAAIVKKVLDEKLVDKVVIVPTIVDYYRDKDDKWLTNNERVAVIKAIMRNHLNMNNDVFVDRHETNQVDQFDDETVRNVYCASRRFIHTLLYIKGAYEADEFYTIIGTDHYRDFKKWFLWEDILKLTKLIVVNGRNGETVAQDEAVPCQFITIDDKYAQVSATKIRREYKGTPYAAGRYIIGIPPLRERVLQHTPIFDLVEKSEVQPGFRPVGINSKDWVCVFAEKGGKVLCVKQLRYGIMQECEELPCGMVEEGETPLLAAIRELYEETGYKVHNDSNAVFFYLGKNASNPAFMNNYMHYFHLDLDYLSYDYETPHPDEHEKLQVYWKDRKRFVEDFEKSCGSAIMAAMLYKMERHDALITKLMKNSI